MEYYFFTTQNFFHLQNFFQLVFSAHDRLQNEDSQQIMIEQLNADKKTLQGQLDDILAKQQVLQQNFY